MRSERNYAFADRRTETFVPRTHMDEPARGSPLPHNHVSDYISITGFNLRERKRQQNKQSTKTLMGNCQIQNLPIDFVRLPLYLIFVVSSFLKYFFKNIITIRSIRKIDETIPTIKIIVL